MRKSLKKLVNNPWVRGIGAPVIAGIILYSLFGNNNTLQLIDSLNQDGNNYQVQGDNNTLNINNPLNDKKSTAIRIVGGSNNSFINNTMSGFDIGIDAVNTTNLQAINNTIN